VRSCDARERGLGLKTEAGRITGLAAGVDAGRGMGWGAEADTGRSEGSEFLELLDGSISQFRDLARHLLLIGYELVEAARYLLLTRGKPVCAACDLLLN
jgi:hypothetical protein